MAGIKDGALRCDKPAVTAKVCSHVAKVRVRRRVTLAVSKSPSTVAIRTFNVIYDGHYNLYEPAIKVRMQIETPREHTDREEWSIPSMSPKIIYIHI